MNKIIFTLCILVFFTYPLSTPCYASSDYAYYRINNSQTYLYNDASLSDEHRIFLLPETYFVKTKLDPVQNVLNVEYNGISGYIDIQNVTRVYGTPVTPYATHNITLSPVSNAIIYSAPTISSQYLGILPYDATSILTYGICLGQDLSSHTTANWYYIQYTSSTQGILTGYIHYSVLSSFTPAPANSEVLDTSPTTPTNGNEILSPELQDTNNILIIILLLIPALFLVYLLLTPRKKHTKRHTPQHHSLIHYNPKNVAKDEFDF